MGDGTTLNVQDGPSVTGYSSYNAASINNGGFNFSGAAVFGSGVNLTSSWGKNVKFSGVLTAASGFSISGGANEYTYYNLLNTANEIGGTIAITRNFASLGIGASGSLGTAAVTTSVNSQYLTYYGTAGMRRMSLTIPSPGQATSSPSRAGCIFPRTWRLRESIPSIPAPSSPGPVPLTPRLPEADWMPAPEP